MYCYFEPQTLSNIAHFHVEGQSTKPALSSWQNEYQNSPLTCVGSLYQPLFCECIHLFICLQYPSQICRMAMLYYWTRECEAGITELRYERRAIQNTKARFQANIAKIPTALARNCFRNLEETMLPLHRLRLENLYTVCLNFFENCSGILFFYV